MRTFENFLEAMIDVVSATVIYSVLTVAAVVLSPILVYRLIAMNLRNR